VSRGLTEDDQAGVIADLPAEPGAAKTLPANVVGTGSQLVAETEYDDNSPESAVRQKLEQLSLGDPTRSMPGSFDLDDSPATAKPGEEGHAKDNHGMCLLVPGYYADPSSAGSFLGRLSAHFGGRKPVGQ